MPHPEEQSAQTDALLVKLLPSAGLRAAPTGVDFRPLHDEPAAAFGADAGPQWYVATLPKDDASPWDLAHSRVADRLGVAESDVLFAEPDIVHRVYGDTGEVTAQGFAVGEQCGPIGQDAGHGKAVGPELAWHLGDAFSGLGKARDAVPFKDPRTRIAHIDTGYYKAHVTTPAHLPEGRERNFVRKDQSPGSAEDPNNKLLVLDNSGHGTGTISILAGGRFTANGKEILLGGAPDADVVPLRIADSVVLFRTSAFAAALHYAVDIGCDVGTMSMGGLPSKSWKEEVDRAYLAGFCLVAAAGNNSNGLPTRHVVYPSRYGRVITACGVMADGRPYAGLEGFTMEGNFGPSSVMGSALGAYTPNIPWAKFGCPELVRLNGEGTSSATPQIAAAVALWFEQYKHELPRDWRRVEAVRHALFTSARKAHKDQLGNGILRAFAALAVRPRLDRPQTKSDRDSFAFLRVITGLGITETPPREEMFNLEIAQRVLVNRELQTIVPDPEGIAALDLKKLKQLMEALIADEGASLALRRHLTKRYPAVSGGPPPRTNRTEEVVPKVLEACDPPPALRNPPRRRLRVYALDPSLSSRFATAAMNEVTLGVRWESLEPGPVGEYLAVDDVDATRKRYDPVDLDDPRLIARDGWAPSEGNAQFHQQMVYAVAMSTIERFERALGRPVLWRHRPNPAKPFDDSRFVQRLVVRPHALRQANAFYSPRDIELQFGYFELGADAMGDQVPGSRVYACLSHDIIAHETTHAILDGMHRRFSEPTNPDVLAFHEGFADIVALMQHFAMPEVLRAEIARTRGDVEAESLLGGLAVQFGQATGRGGALREGIGRIEGGKWQRLPADPAELSRRLTPHSRGAILVAAVFDAFITIYKSRIADLLRIYTGGTGELALGAIHPDLVNRLADEADKSASHVLTMCIRALDYLPPVDVTFFEYLRALITADSDLVHEDRFNYRLAFIEAFRRRGIFPLSAGSSESTVPSMAVDTLRWQGIDESSLKPRMLPKIRKEYAKVIESLKTYVNECFYLGDREELFEHTRKRRKALQRQLTGIFKAVPAFAEELGLAPGRSFEVHELRRALRESPNGRVAPEVIVSLTQQVTIAADRKQGIPAHTFRGGSTLVVDLSASQVKYRILKRVQSKDRRARTAEFLRQNSLDPLRALFFGMAAKEPFAALHALADEGSGV
jgi:hypothetical protein